MKYPLSSTITALRSLKWSGNAIDVTTYQRLNLRMLLLGAVYVFPISLLMVAASAFLQPPASIIVLIALGVVMFALIAWIAFQGCKLQVLRLRYHGASGGWKIAGIIISFCLLGGLGSYSQMNHGFTNAPLMVLSLLTILTALFMYMVEFEEQPLVANQTPIAQPLNPSTKGERIGLFFLQTWMWYGILVTPVHIMFPVQ